MIPTTMSGRMKIRSLSRFLYFSFPLSSLQIATCIQRVHLWWLTEAISFVHCSTFLTGVRKILWGKCSLRQLATFLSLTLSPNYFTITSILTHQFRSCKGNIKKIQLFILYVPIFKAPLFYGGTAYLSKNRPLLPSMLHHYLYRKFSKSQERYAHQDHPPS